MNQTDEEIDNPDTWKAIEERRHLKKRVMVYIMCHDGSVFHKYIMVKFINKRSLSFGHDWPIVIFGDWLQLFSENKPGGDNTFHLARAK